MASEYTREQLRICIAKICLAAGWNTSHVTPMEVLVDILSNYLFHLGKTTCDYANLGGTMEPNLNHVALAFKHLGVNLSDLQKYVENTNCVDAPTSVPKYPVPKEDHLNFLKPGNDEVVSRPIHIHGHLPPMNHLLRVDQHKVETLNVNEENFKSDDCPTVLNYPSGTSQMTNFENTHQSLAMKLPREVNSVIMTTSGFLSPMLEGKIPESQVNGCILELMEQTYSPIPLVGSNESLEIEPKKLQMKVSRTASTAKELFKPTIDYSDEVSNSTSIGSSFIPFNQLNAPCDIPNAQLSYLLDNKYTTTPLTAELKMNILNILGIPIDQSVFYKTEPEDLKSNEKVTDSSINTKALEQAELPEILKIDPKSEKVPRYDEKVASKPAVKKIFAKHDKNKMKALKKIFGRKNLELESKIMEKATVSSPGSILDNSCSSSHDVQSNPWSLYENSSLPVTPSSTPKTPDIILESPHSGKKKRKCKKIVKRVSPADSVLKIAESDLECPETPDIRLEEESSDNVSSLIVNPCVALPGGPIVLSPFYHQFPVELINLLKQKDQVLISLNKSLQKMKKKYKKQKRYNRSKKRNRDKYKPAKKKGRK